MQVRIKGYTFELTAPYREGTVITRGEAQALNNLRLENIQNNVRDWVADAASRLGPGELISTEGLVALQARITEYDQRYAFVEKGQPRNRLGDIELETRAVARERAEAAFRQQERTPTPDELEEAISLNMVLPAVVEEARDRVAAKRRVLGSETLSGLLE